MGVLANYEPRRVMDYFEEILEIPRETYNTKQMSDYAVKWANARGFEVRQDEMNNVVIKKPGTEGYEDSEPIILQGHLDMVCTAVEGKEIDFRRDGIEAYVEDGFLKARGTSLGADNGIALAMIFAILESDDIPHPPIEAIMTSDEEDGLLGAQAIDMSDIQGTKLLNIDGELEGVLTIGCSGGIRGEVRIPLVREEVKGAVLKLHLHGLLGGHSGAEIHKQRGNAHKLMGRFLYQLNKKVPVHIVEMSGGAQDNVISHVSKATIVVPADSIDDVFTMVKGCEKIWIDEFMGEEPDLVFDVYRAEGEVVSACDEQTTNNIINFLEICPNGVMGYSRKLEGLVETSLNIGAVKFVDDEFVTMHYLRSSVDTCDYALWDQLECVAKVVGGRTVMVTDYLAWPMKLDTELQKIMTDVYEEMFGEDVEIVNLHAGLEPALFFLKKPELECISYGPNIYDVHSVNEKMDLASVKRCWDYTLEILRRCK